LIKRTESEITKSWNKNYDNPLVSIRCITYNQEDYIAMALDGFLMQETEYPFEILVHDDASTDKTADIIREYETKFPNIIRPIYEVENQYSKHDGSLRRIINSHIRGEYVLLCEGDDYWTDSHKLQMQVEYMISHPECTLCFHAVNYLLEKRIVKNDRISEYECDIPTEKIILGGGFYCATPSLCLKKEDLLCFPRFRQIADVGDYPLQIMLATIGSVHYFPNICGVYRVNAKGSWTSSQSSVDVQVKHWNNQIEWLSEYNDYSNYEYTDAVFSKIIYCYCSLYRIQNTDVCLKMAFKSVKRIDSYTDKIKNILGIIRCFISVNLPFLGKVKRNVIGIGKRIRKVQNES